MDEKPIRQALEALAKEEITDDMNLWPTIKAQIDSSKPVQNRRWFGFGRMILVALIFLMSAVAYALYQASNGDPGLESVQAEKLITPLNLTQTIDGITVKMDWGYADSNRILLGYTVDEPQGVNTAPVAGMPFSLSDSSGNYFVTDSMVGFGGLKVEPEADTITDGFDPTCLGTNQPDKLDLTFNLALSVEQVTQSFSGGGGGGGGGGGNSSGCLQVGDVSQTPPSSDQKIVQFKFQFSLPMIHAVNITDQQSVTANGIEMHTESLSVSPSMTRVRLCYSLPDQSNDWSPKGDEAIGDDQVPFQGNSIEPAEDGSGNCADVMIPAPYIPGKTTTMTLNVTDLMTSYNFSPENSQSFTALLAQKGVTINVTGTGEGFNYSIVSQPKDLSDDQLNVLISDAMEQAFRRYHAGPWTFTFNLP